MAPPTQNPPPSIVFVKAGRLARLLAPHLVQLDAKRGVDIGATRACGAGPVVVPQLRAAAFRGAPQRAAAPAEAAHPLQWLDKHALTVQLRGGFVSGHHRQRRGRPHAAQTPENTPTKKYKRKQTIKTQCQCLPPAKKQKKPHLRNTAVRCAAPCMAAYSSSDRRRPSASPASSKNFIFSTNRVRSALIPAESHTHTACEEVKREEDEPAARPPSTH